tara:strand:+ start:91 stop:600 length:510 start_codon:yes stop_codon:yes gene_type:complete
MVSYSSNFFENDISSIVILISVIHFLPNVLKTYIGPQFIKAARNNDIIRNFCVLVSIILLVELSSVEDNKLVISCFLFLFLLIFSRQTIEFNMIQIILMLYIFSKYNENDDLESIKKYFYLLFGLLLFGYFRYYRKQVSDKGLKFSLVKFILGLRETEYNFEYIDFMGL